METNGPKTDEDKRGRRSLESKPSLLVRQVLVLIGVLIGGSGVSVALAPPVDHLVAFTVMMVAISAGAWLTGLIVARTSINRQSKRKTNARLLVVAGSVLLLAVLFSLVYQDLTGKYVRTFDGQAVVVGPQSALTETAQKFIQDARKKKGLVDISEMDLLDEAHGDRQLLWSSESIALREWVLRLVFTGSLFTCVFLLCFVAEAFALLPTTR